MSNSLQQKEAGVDGLQQVLRYVIYVYVFTAPFYYFRLWNLNIVPTDFVGIGLVICWAAWKLNPDETLYLNPYLLIPVALGIFALFSTLYSPYKFEAMGSAYLLIYLSVCALIIYDWAASTDVSTSELHRLFLLWSLGAVLMTIYIFYHRYLEIGLIAFSPAMTYDERTQLPYLLVASGIYTAIVYAKPAVSVPHPNKGVLFLLYQFSAFVLAVSFSRGPWLAFIVIMGFVFLFHSNVRRGFITLNLPAVIAGVAVTFYFGQAARFVSRISSIFEPSDSETIGRVEIYQHAIGVMVDSPILGIGFNNYAEVFNISGSAHSTYLMIGSELGVIALLLYLLIPLSLSRNWMFATLRNQTTQRSLIGIALASALLGLLVGQTFSAAILWFRAFWVVFALAIAAMALSFSNPHTAST